jgi:hypothetical protein
MIFVAGTLSLTFFAGVVAFALGDFLPPTLLLRGVTLGIIFLSFSEGREDGVSKGLPPVVVGLVCSFSFLSV